MRESVPVALGARSYEVRIGTGLIAQAGSQIAPLLRRPRVAVVADETVAALHLGALRDGLGDIGMVGLNPACRRGHQALARIHPHRRMAARTEGRAQGYRHRARRRGDR